MDVTVPFGGRLLLRRTLHAGIGRQHLGFPPDFIRSGREAKSPPVRMVSYQP